MKRSSILLIIIFILLFSNLNIFAEFTESENDISEMGCYKQKNDSFAEDASLPEIEQVETNNIVDWETSQYDHVDHTFLNEYAAYYFLQLKNNFGRNEMDTCSYVAAAMLLSFYDTFWDDNIISESYDKITDSFNINNPIANNIESPGIRREGSDELAYESYTTTISNHAGTHFHLELIRLGTQELGMGYSIMPWKIQDLLQYYLYTIKGYSESYVSVEFIDWPNTQKRQQIINLVKDGIPVIVSGGDLDWGHSYIVYDYDEANDELYCHMGWKGQINSDGDYDTTHVALSSIEGTLLGGVVYLDFKTEHFHSNNYIGAHNKEYCSCFYFDHPAHECSRYYKEYNETHHTYACDCNPSEENLFEHNFVCDGVENSLHYERCADCGYSVNQWTQYQYSNISATQHLKACTDCGYSVTSEHDMTIPVPLSGTEHGRKCIDCNYVDESTVEPHSFNSWVSVNTTTHQSECDGCNARETTTAPHAFVPVKGSLFDVVCIGCGYTKRKDSDFGNVIMSITKVSANGSYILPDGTIMLVDEDIDAHLNGTLVFYDKNNVPQTQ